MLFKAVMNSRKNQKLFGLQKFRVPVDIKNGPQYMIEFAANLTIPELSMSTNLVDFDRVCVNTRKTIKIRLENNKEITCEWNFCAPSVVPAIAATGAPTEGEPKKSSKGRDEGEKFTVFPHSGVLQPGQKQTIDVMFTPGMEKVYQDSLEFRCN